MNEYWTQEVNEQNEDLKSMRIRDDFKLSLTDKAYINLKALAYKAGFNSPGELLSSFIGDLTGWGYTNGSDERDYADRWYERAFGMSEYEAYFIYHLYNMDFTLADMADLLEDEEYFEDIYEYYLDDSEKKATQTKEECKKLMKKLLEKGEDL